MYFDIKIIIEKTTNVEIIKIKPRINICKLKLISFVTQVLCPARMKIKLGDFTSSLFEKITLEANNNEIKR